jgi:hypothetical protein
MNWFWLNIPLATMFFLAWTLIPLWMVIKYPDQGPPVPGPDRRAAGRTAAAADPGQAPYSPATAAWGEAAHTDPHQLPAGAGPLPRQ